MIFNNKRRHVLYASHWSTFGFLAPVLIMFSVFVVWPILQSLYLGFTRWDGFSKPEWIGLENYANLFKDPKFLSSLYNNLLWLIFSLLAPVLGLALALFLNQKIKGMRIIKSLFFFPFVINLVVVGLVFSWYYNPDFGLLALLAKALGQKPLPILVDENLATFGIIGAALWPQTAYCMILYLTGLTNIDTNVIEAAHIDGAHRLNMLFHVILPQLRPATFIAVVITIIGALRSFDLIAIMTAGGPWGSSYVLSYYMYEQALFNFKMGYAAAIATVLFLIMSVYIAFFLVRMLKDERR